jgi:hypothetical protein
MLNKSRTTEFQNIKYMIAYAGFEPTSALVTFLDVVPDGRDGRFQGVPQLVRPGADFMNQLRP